LDLIKAARKLTTAVKDVMGGVVQESPRFSWKGQVQRKGFVQNMDIYKTARFQKDDFIEYENRKGQVKGFDGKKILLNDLESQDVLVGIVGENTQD